SFEAGGWTEDTNPNTAEYRALARFAYANQRNNRNRALRFLVTQARQKIARGKLVNIAFIVCLGDV
ncbi:hypothetical protein MTO96_039713, partial [Rhipicephalus appendiculatus]